MGWLARTGLAARGAVYLVMGWLTVLVALGGKAHIDQRGALTEVIAAPFGSALVLLLALGFAAYAAWRFSEVAVGVTGEGDGAGPRLAALARALTYSVLAITAISVLRGARGTQAGQQGSIAAEVMSHQGGRLLVGLVGVAVVAVGAVMIHEGWSEKFLRYFGALPPGRRWVIPLGRIGHRVARGGVRARRTAGRRRGVDRAGEQGRRGRRGSPDVAGAALRPGARRGPGDRPARVRRLRPRRGRLPPGAGGVLVTPTTGGRPAAEGTAPPVLRGEGRRGAEPVADAARRDPRPDLEPLDLRRVLVRLVVSGLGLALALSVVGWIIVAVQGSSSLQAWETDVETAWFRARTPALNTASYVASHLSETITCIALLVISFFLLRWWLGRYRESWTLVAAIVGELLVFLIVTAAVNRARPGVPHLDAAPPTSSFPSGHTAAAVAIYGCLAVVLARNVRSRPLARVLVTLCVLVPFVVAASRLYRGMHHPTDLLFGLIGGGAWLLIVITTMLPRSSDGPSAGASAGSVADDGAVPRPVVP